MTRTRWPALALAGAALLGGCERERADRDAAADPAVERQGARAEVPERPELELEVSIAARELRVYRNGRVAETHGVAVGSEEWPTRTGEWTIDEVVLNPRWVPPDEEWAEDEDEVEAGDPENPLGAAQLVYDRPRSIHGTIEPGSIGQAVSHGSIRVHNDVALQLARQVMEAAGVENVQERLDRAEREPDRSQTIRLPRGIPIRVVDGG